MARDPLRILLSMRRRSVEQLMGERAVADQADAAKREQHVLDDIARGRLTLHQRS